MAATQAYRGSVVLLKINLSFARSAQIAVTQHLFPATVEELVCFQNQKYLHVGCM